MKEVLIMKISKNEFKNNFDIYMDLVKTEDIYVTENGKTIGVFINPEVNSLKALQGMFANYKDFTENDIKEKRLKEKYGEYI